MKKTITSVALLLLGLGGIQAQEAITTAGGEATGSGGSASYTVGETLYSSNTGDGGSTTQGVQQPYSITELLGTEEIGIQLELLVNPNVFPNPTSNFLTLKVEEFNDLNYQLYDLQGKALKRKKVNSNTTTIKMGNLTSATYVLKVFRGQNLVKVFRIVKN